MATDFEMPTLRQIWRRWRQSDQAMPPHRRRNLPTMPSSPVRTPKSVPPAKTIEPKSWAQVQHVVRQWPSGMPVSSDLIAQVFGVGRGQAWRWLERLEQAGLVYVTVDPPNAGGMRRKRRWVV